MLWAVLVKMVATFKLKLVVISWPSNVINVSLIMDLESFSKLFRDLRISFVCFLDRDFDLLSLFAFVMITMYSKFRHKCNSNLTVLTVLLLKFVEKVYDFNGFNGPTLDIHGCTYAGTYCILRASKKVFQNYFEIYVYLLCVF